MNLKLNRHLKQILKEIQRNQEIKNYNNLGGDTENDNKCYDKFHFLKSLFEQFNIVSSSSTNGVRLSVYLHSCR